MTPRRKLGRTSSIGKREVIFLTAEAIECDSSDQFHLAQRRVLFEDAELLTLHRQTDKLFITVTGIVALLTLVGGGALYINTREIVVAFTPLLIGVVFAALAIFRLTLKPSVITVFGKRSTIAIRFTINHAQARATYQELQTVIHAAQQRERLQSTAAPAVELPAAPMPDFEPRTDWPDTPFAPRPDPPRDPEP
jgi:hypothetical protein